MAQSKMPPLDTPEQIQAWHDKLKKAENLIDALDIPSSKDAFGAWVVVYAHDLYDILMDEEKLKELVSKLKLKAFW